MEEVKKKDLSESDKKYKMELAKNILPILIVILVIISLINSMIIFSMSTSAEKAILAAKEKARPARLEITKITVTGCDDCYDVDNIIDEIKLQNVNITKEETLDFSIDNAKSIIARYRIKKLPTFLVKGELMKFDQLKDMWNELGEIKNNTFIFITPPPYYSVEKMRIVGIVDATIISDKACNNCTNVSLIIDQLKLNGMKIISKDVDYNSTEGSLLVQRYNLTRIPTILLTEDAGEYKIISQIWNMIGTVESGMYVLREVNPPYRNLTTNEIQGMVSVIYLSDGSCLDCYNVSIHREILRTGFGVFILNETKYDINSTVGKNLITKYKITFVPTIIISPDVQYYTSIRAIWPQVGTIESDGWYVFRNLSVLQVTYKDISTGKIIMQ